MPLDSFSAQTDFGEPSRMSSSAQSPTTEDRDANLGWLDGFTEMLGGRESESGTKVTHQSAMRMPAFWQGVTLISGDVAKIPLEIYKRDGNDRAVDPTHPAYSVVRYQANPDQSAFEWRRQMMVHVLVWGNAYSLIERNGRGDVTALYPLLPDRTNCKIVDGKKQYQTEINGSMEYFNSYDIWHLKGITFDGNQGLDVVSYARDGIGKILARIKFTSKFFKHGGRLGGILELPATKNVKKLAKIEEGFRKNYEGSDAAFKTVILRENAKFHLAQSTFKDAQLVEVGVEDDRVVARLLNIPPHKLGIPGTSSHNSLEAENKSYHNSSLSHHFCGIESECWMKLFQKQTRKRGLYFFEHTIGALLWADSAAVATIGNGGVMAGWIRPNEPRKWFNLPQDPDGDKLLIPSGMVYAGETPLEDPDDPPDGDVDDPDDETDDGNDDARSLSDALKTLIHETDRRFLKRLVVAATKAARKSDTFEAWLGTDLDDHLTHGRKMFAAVQDIQLAATGRSHDYADLIVTRFRGNIHAAMNAGENIIETIGDLCE